MAKIQNPQNQYGENLATNDYLESVKEELIGNIENVESELTGKIETVKSELTENIENVESELTKNIDLVSIDVSEGLKGLSGDLDAIKDYVDNKVDTEQIRAEEVENEIKDAIAINAEATVINAEAIANETDRAVATETSLKEETVSEEVSVWDITTSFSDGATNVSDFTCDSPISGFLSQVRIYCSPKNATSTAAWLEIRQNDDIIARSTNSQTHGKGNLLEFNFNKILINAGDRYGFYIVNEDGTTPDNSCLALKKKAEVPEVADLNVEVSNWAEYTPRFGFSYYKSNKKILATHINDTVLHVTQSDKDKWNNIPTVNINNLYDKDDNIESVSDETIKFSDNDTPDITPFNPENIISAQYAFRTTKGDSDEPTANSNLKEFNLRTIYTSTNGTTTSGGRIDKVDDGIELYPGSNGYYYYRDSVPVEYEQDLLWKDDEEYQTLGSLINGTGMFMRNKLITFNDDLTCLTTAKGMFGTNHDLTDFKSPLPSLVNAKSMFTACRALTEWRVKLPSLVIGSNMFSDLDSKMELTSVDTCLPNLTMARQMFAGCTKLTKFHVPSTSFSNLYDARDMFYGCPITSINGNFESLEDATNMLPNAHLDLASIKNIAETIRDWSEGYPAGINDEDGSTQIIAPSISLGIGFENIDGDENVIAVKEELDKIKAKGWQVFESWNGPAGVSTISESNKGFFARLYDSGEFNTYITEDGNPCSIITTDSLRWILDKDSWSPMVSSIEEAVAYFNLTKIENTEETN